MTNTEFGTAYEKGFHRTVCFLASRGLPDPEAQEIAQAAWARGWERRCQLREQGMIFSWINSIAVNMSRNQFRRNARVQGLEEAVDLRPGPSSAGACADLDHLFSKCDKLDRSLLWMQAIGGFTTAEIGKHHGLKPSTVRVRLMRAKSRLRQQSRRRVSQTNRCSRRLQHTVSV
jgi:RNA polymerase sigma factor (sigma-70 family)